MVKTLIPVGPYHPLLKEPEYLQVWVEGERILEAKINIGYNHRGIELLLQQKPWEQTIPLIERICGICELAHGNCFSVGVETLQGADIPERAKYIRTIFAELERIHSNSLCLALVAEQIGLETVFMMIMRDRERVMDLFERISGGRVHHALNVFGGTRVDFSQEDVKKTLEATSYLRKQFEDYLKIFERDAIVRRRLENEGVLQRKDAADYSVVGPVARASGIKIDRRQDKYLAYGNADFEIILDKRSDALARTSVRTREVLEALRIIEQLVKSLPEGKTHLPARFDVPQGETVSVVEAPRGENMHYIVSDGSKNPERIRIRPPTYANIQILDKILANETIADVPPIVLSLDPCFSCCDRMLITNAKTGKTRQVKGVDITA